MAEPGPVAQFQPTTGPALDWSAAANWSGGVVPGAGDAAAISGITAMIDPGVTIEASLALASSGSMAAGLFGNQGAVVLGQNSSVTIAGRADLYANDSVVNQGVVALGAGAALDVVVDLGAVSGLTGAAPPSFANEGMIALTAGAALEIGGTDFVNGGIVMVSGGALTVAGGPLGGGGTISLSQGSVADFTDGVAAQTLLFGLGGATVTIEDPLLGPNLTIGGFGDGDRIELPNLADATMIQAGSVVSIFDRAGTIEGGFTMATAAPLALVADGAGSAIVMSDPPCFARGTAILTRAGYRPVESLREGDIVVTASGGMQPVIWVGSHCVDLAVHPSPRKVRPIRFAPGALGHGVPRRVLRLSPDHAVSIDGVLIPAKLLVNDATIVQERDCLAVTYHRVELATHDVLLAEGARCESYLDTGNRAGFSTAIHWPVRPKRWDRDACAPLVTTGTRLRAAREILHERALALGYQPQQAGAMTLLLDDQRVSAYAAGCFALPPRHSGAARIVSARFVPASLDPASEDRRELGVALAGIRVGDRQVALESMACGGFYPRAAGDAALWTDGAGELRLPLSARHLTLDIAALPIAWAYRGALQ